MAMPASLALIMLLMMTVLAGPGSAAAQTLGNARVGFSAERILIFNGQSYTGKMWHMPGEQRHEQEFPALKPVFILHAGSSVGDIVLPQLHTVVEFALPKELALLGSPDLARQSVGEETVNGVATTKYAVDENTGEGHATGTLWLTPDGIPMECDAKFEAKSGKVSTIHWELRHLKIGRQDAALFKAPQGYAKLPAEAAATLLGIRLARPAR
jgi:hypothetical protein